MIFSHDNVYMPLFYSIYLSLYPYFQIEISISQVSSHLCVFITNYYLLSSTHQVNLALEKWNIDFVAHILVIPLGLRAEVTWKSLYMFALLVMDALEAFLYDVLLPQDLELRL